MNEHANESFRAQVERLVAEGKLTPEEAAGLLEGEDRRAAPGPAQDAPHVVTVSDPGETPPDLDLHVTGYSLTVLHDPSVGAPHLSANHEDQVNLTATPEGWRVTRVQRQSGLRPPVKAILTLPFVSRHVRARVSGGNLHLPDVAGEVRADVNGGNLRLGNALSLQAEVNGGNLQAGEIEGPTHLNVNGGGLSVARGGTLNAGVNGGNLRWAGRLTGGDHRVEVNAGNVNLGLLPGSSVRVDAEVTVGGFMANFPTTKSGGFLNTHHSGQVGNGAAGLSCRVTAGQLMVNTA